MEIVLIPDSEWKFGEEDRKFDVERNVIFLRQTNSTITSEMPNDALPLEDDTDVYKMLFPNYVRQVFSLEEYAKNISSRFDKNYSQTETYEKVLNLQRKIKELELQEQIKKDQEAIRIKNDQQMKMDMERNIEILKSNAENLPDIYL
jgi:hypothetical protein